jgi:hypothetical protein
MIFEKVRMKTMNTFIKIALIALHLITISNSAYASIFGPKSYDECIIKQMKGQDGSVLPSVRRLCSKEFPPELLLSSDLVKSNWCSSSRTKQTICIEGVAAGYEITKITVEFMSDHCNFKTNKSTVKIADAKKSKFSNKIDIHLPDGVYNCANIYHYGIKRN